MKSLEAAAAASPAGAPHVDPTASAGQITSLRLWHARPCTTQALVRGLHVVIPPDSSAPTNLTATWGHLRGWY
jgi:hypothetical protein